MKLAHIVRKPVDRQGSWHEEVDKILANATDAVMYTTKAFNQGEGERTLHIFALISERTDSNEQ